MTVQTLSDIQNLERVPLSERYLAPSTYEALRQAAKQHAWKPALSFFPEARDFTDPFEWNYSQLFASITRAANAFHDLGIVPGEVIAFILPNLPETHFTIWGGEAAGIVMAINPQLEAKQMASLLHTAKASVVVTLAPTPGSDLWPKLASQLDQLPLVKHVVWVSMEPYVSEPLCSTLRALAQQARAQHNGVPIHELRALMNAQPGRDLKSFRQIRAEEHSSYFCTGGTHRTAENSGTHPWFGGLQCLGHDRSLAAIQQWPGDLLRPATVPCQWTTGHRVNALDSRRSCDPGNTARVSWRRGDRPLLGDGRALRYQLLFRRARRCYPALLQTELLGRNLSSLSYALCGAAPLPVELFQDNSQDSPRQTRGNHSYRMLYV